MSPRPELAQLDQLTADLPRRADLLAAKVARLADYQKALSGDCCIRCLADHGQCTGTGGPKPCPWDSVPRSATVCAFCDGPYGSCETTGGPGGCEGHYEALALRQEIHNAPTIHIGGTR